KYSNIQFNVNNTNFENNEGTNGGAIYFGKDKEEKGNQILNMNNIKFISNKSEYFGGAIYSKKYQNLYSLNINNSRLINNYAGVAGGAFFSPTLPQNYLYNFSNCELINNKAESHGNNYATNPSLIKILDPDKYNNVTMTSGSYLPMKFSIFDSFGHNVLDPHKYYLDIFVKVFVRKKMNSNKNALSILSGNVGSFVNVFEVETVLEEEIIFDKNYIDINIGNCNKNQYQIYDNNILKCENPKCHDSCLESTAKCIISDGNVHGKNIINNNKCLCNNGWIGKNCNIKDYVDFSFNNDNINDSSGSHLGIELFANKNNFKILSLPTALKTKNNELFRSNDTNGKTKISTDSNLDNNYDNLLKVLKNISSILIITVHMKKMDKNDDVKQGNDGKWLYIFPLKDYDLIINIYEFIMIMILIKLVVKLWNLTGIFKNAIYMSYAVIFWAATGPLTQKKGNDCTCYFILNKADMCITHRVYNCSCNINITNNNLIAYINQYIQYYNYTKILSNKRRADSITHITNSFNSIIINSNVYN
ncbi:hypothetical protein PIROE2DRAFT_6384, partial [Piromyces sp. E2]